MWACNGLGTTLLRQKQYAKGVLELSQRWSEAEPWVEVKKNGLALKERKNRFLSATRTVLATKQSDEE
jgi:hypothetical protein